MRTKWVLLALPFFVFSCMPPPTKPQQKVIVPKERVDMSVYYETLKEDCGLTVEKIYELTGHGDELRFIPPRCRKLKIAKAPFIVSSLSQKQKICFKGIDFKGVDGKQIKEALYRKAQEVLRKNYCF